jgi:hypothetical protein
MGSCVQLVAQPQKAEASKHGQDLWSKMRRSAGENVLVPSGTMATETCVQPCLPPSAAFVALPALPIAAPFQAVFSKCEGLLMARPVSGR